jgi:hypothetical protein
MSSSLLAGWWERDGDGVHHQHPRHPIAGDDDNLPLPLTSSSSSSISGFGIIDYHYQQQQQIMPSLSDSSASATIMVDLVPSLSSSEQDNTSVIDNNAAIDRSNTGADTNNSDKTNSSNTTMLASIQAQFTRVVSLDQDTFSGNVNDDASPPPVTLPDAGALIVGGTAVVVDVAAPSSSSSAAAAAAAAVRKVDNAIPPPTNYYLTTPVEGSKNFLMMDAKFSPIVWRSINDLDHRGCDDRSSSNAIGTEVLAAASDSKTMRGTNTTTLVVTHRTKATEEEVDDHTAGKEELPTIPSPPLIRHSSEAGPPKIPTLRDDDDDDEEATTSTTATVHANLNNDNNGNDKDDDEEVAGICSNYMIKSPPLAPRKRSLGYDDSPHPFSGSGSNLFFSEERLPSKIYWIPPRRPTKKSRLFLYTSPDDDKAEQDPKVEKELMLGEHHYLEPEKKELEDDHRDEEGSVATFSVSSSTGFSIDTPRSSYSPTFSLHSTSAIDSSAVAAATTTTTTTTAQHTLNGRLVRIPTGMSVKNFMASEMQDENAPANLVFTPPRRPEAQAVCL